MTRQTLERELGTYAPPATLAADSTRRVSPLLRRFVWSGVVFLAALGVLSAVMRGVFVSDTVTRFQPVRNWMFDAAGLVDPLASTRAAELEVVDARFGRHRVATYLHVAAGAVFLILAPFQFSTRIRRRHVRFHRWSGRLLVLTAVLTAIAGLFFGLLMPYAGLAEVIVVALFGGLFLVAIAKAYLAIRRRDVATHRRWMIRAFAVALGIATARLAGLAVDLTLSPAGLPAKPLFVLALWIGWGSTVGAAELWLAYTRGVRHVLGQT